MGRTITEYILTRSKRKTVSLAVNSDLTVDVRAPMRMVKADIDRFVQKHEGWIAKQRQRLQEESRCREAFHFADGDRFLYRGEACVLATGERKRPILENGRLLLPPATDRPAAVAAFLRVEARRLVAERIDRYAPLLGVTPTGVKITSATTRWGSCSGKNSLCFAYRVACLPDEQLDYIVVHELSHIREHNHSARFWAVVETVLPDWTQRRARLRDIQKQLTI